MSSILKIILLVLFILSSIGSLFWWMKEKGYAPLLALIGSVITILMWYLDNKSSNNTHKKVNEQFNTVKYNTNSPIANNVEQQNIYYNEMILSKTLNIQRKRKNLNIQRKRKNLNIKLVIYMAMTIQLFRVIIIK